MMINDTPNAMLDISQHHPIFWLEVLFQAQNTVASDFGFKSVFVLI